MTPDEFATYLRLLQQIADAIERRTIIAEMETIALQRLSNALLLLVGVNPP